MGMNDEIMRKYNFEFFSILTDWLNFLRKDFLNSKSHFQRPSGEIVLLKFSSLKLIHDYENVCTDTVLVLDFQRVIHIFILEIYRNNNYKTVYGKFVFFFFKTSGA